jgi:molybdate/tungstate transport system permease protein
MQRTVGYLASVIAALLASVLLLFLVAPLGGILASGGGAGIRQLLTDHELRSALTLTALTATAATLLGALCGTPIAYALARFRFRGRSVLAAILDMPLLLPHPVAGIAILLVLGRNTVIGETILATGFRIVGTPAGIVAAMLFVSVPLYISAAREAFTRVDRKFEAIARTLGDTPWAAFRRVTLPMSLRGLAAAAIVMWARAVSEFGAIVILAYNPKVASVLAYDRFTSFGLPEALPVAAALVLLALIPLAALRALRYEREAETVL